MSNRRKKDRSATDDWVKQERAQAQQANQNSEDQLAKAERLGEKSNRVGRRFHFLKQRNMFAEGFRLIIKESHR